jgi:hypothetical protein
MLFSSHSRGFELMRENKSIPNPALSSRRSRDCAGWSPSSDVARAGDALAAETAGGGIVDNGFLALIAKLADYGIEL